MCISVQGHPRVQGRPRMRRSRSRRVLTRTVPLVVVAAAALAFGLYEADAPGRDQRAVIRRYVQDWARADYGAMWAMLSPSSQRRISRTEFAAELTDAEETATATSVTPVRLLSIQHHWARESFVVHTQVFGRLQE